MHTPAGVQAYSRWLGKAFRGICILAGMPVLFEALKEPTAQTIRLRIDSSLRRIHTPAYGKSKPRYAKSLHHARRCQAGNGGI
jgi:hypothetical protein